MGVWTGLNWLGVKGRAFGIAVIPFRFHKTRKYLDRQINYKLFKKAPEPCILLRKSRYATDMKNPVSSPHPAYCRPTGGQVVSVTPPSGGRHSPAGDMID